MRKLLTFLIFTLTLALIVPLATKADELDDVTRELDEQKQQLAELEAKKNALSDQISSAYFSLSQVSAELEEAEAELAAIEEALAEKEALLTQWEIDRNLLIRDLYKKSRISPIEVALSEDTFSGSAQQFYYYEESINLLVGRIELLNGEISVFRENKAQAEEIRNDLADLKGQYQAILASRQAAQSSVSSQLAQVKASIQGLTAKQEQLLSAKFAASATSETVGDSEPLSEPLPEPGFAPAFMVASYGVPHRVGMNQYGAYGRAQSGQTYDQILKTYYANVAVGSYAVPPTINVEGYGEVSFEDNYLRGISEMPRSWPMEALKAQAVAARTYALDYILRSGSPICTTQSCQVYNGTADRINCEGYYNQRWCDAVNATRGIVVTYGGTPVATYYSSTAGGYTLSSEGAGWNPRAWLQGIKDYGPNGAYDGPNYGNSAWYHTGWGSRNCSKYEYNPWLTSDELADIFNAALLYQKSSNYTQYLWQTDGCICSAYPEVCKPPDWSPPWSANQVKAKLIELGTQPINSVSAVIVNPSPPGATTASVYVDTDRGALEFSASTFRAVFNLRAPGYLMIKTGRFDFESR
jgi:SpoIID/LytB domain protein